MYHSQPLPAGHMPSFYSPSPLLPMMTQSCDVPALQAIPTYRSIDEVILPPNLENRSSRSIERILDEHGNERVREDYSSGGGRGAGMPYYPYNPLTADLFTMNCASQLFGELNLNHFAYVSHFFKSIYFLSKHDGVMRSTLCVVKLLFYFA